MNLILFLITIMISFVAVMIGAVAFHLTGLEWSLAKFQALSCFSGTGFTTKEAELITGYPQRRKIASVLMVLGNAGLITLIATFANSLRPNIYMPKFKIPLIHLVVPSKLVPLINLIIVIIVLYVAYKIFTHTTVLKRITKLIKSHMVKKEIVKPVSFEELLVATGGYGISSIEISEDSPILNRTLQDSGLRSHGITVLVLERKDETIPNPPAGVTLQLYDKLICFGKLDDIKNKIGY